MSRFLEMVSNLVSFCVIIDFREMWWGSTLMGNPKVKKLKFIKIFNQLVQVNESTLHLLFCSLSLHTVAVDLVDLDQRTATPLQFLNDLQDKVHSFFPGFFKQRFLAHPSLRLNSFPVVAQFLQVIVNLFQDRLITASDRHDECSRPVKILRVTNDASPLLYLTLLHQSQPSFSMTSSKGDTPHPPTT